MKFELADFPAELVNAIAGRVAVLVIERLAPPPTDDVVMDTRGAAAYLNLSAAQLEIWRCRGGGPVFIKLARRVRYRRSDLDRWLDQQRRGSTSEGTS